MSGAFDVEMPNGQENLDWLVRWCQLIGLSPFRMERHPESGRFQRFAFSWRHPLTCWWLLLKVVHAAVSVVWTWTGWVLTSAIIPSSTTLAINQFMLLNLTASQLIFPEVIGLRYPLMARVSRRLLEVDAFLADRGCPPCTTRKRTAAAVLGALVTVSFKRRRKQ